MHRERGMKKKKKRKGDGTGRSNNEKKGISSAMASMTQPKKSRIENVAKIGQRWRGGGISLKKSRCGNGLGEKSNIPILGFQFLNKFASLIAGAAVLPGQ